MILCQRLNINLETKLYHFVNGLKPHLKKALLLRHLPDYDIAMSYAKQKYFTLTNTNDRLLEQIKQLTFSNTREEPPFNNLNHPDPVKLT